MQFSSFFTTFFHHALILFLLALHFPLFSSYFCSHFFSFMRFTLFSFALPFRPFVLYANFSVSAITISPWAFDFAPSAFVQDLKCLTITRLTGSITCRVTQFLRNSFLFSCYLSFSFCAIREIVNELTRYRFYARFCRVLRRFIGDDIQKPKSRQTAQEPGKSAFSMLT